MHATIALATHDPDLAPRDHGNHSAPHRRGGAWRRHLTIAAAGLAIVASAAVVTDHAATAGRESLTWTEGNGQPTGGITVTTNFIADVPSHVGYVKKVELGKVVGEVAVVTVPRSR